MNRASPVFPILVRAKAIVLNGAEYEPLLESFPSNALICHSLVYLNLIESELIDCCLIFPLLSITSILVAVVIV
jgi:hypothetical protein